jgi:spore maturation protein SpmB
MSANEMAKNQNVVDLFVNGARRGFTIATTNLMPNVVLAFIFIRALTVTGLLDIFAKACAPIMALWGLPGEAAAVLLAAFMSMGGGVGVAASLFMDQHLSAADLTLLLPAIYLLGNPLQNVGRCLGTAEVDTRYFTPITVICIFNALVCMWVMRAILVFF